MNHESNEIESSDDSLLNATNVEHAEDKNDENKLNREVTLLGGISVIVGSMIGSGIFISPVGVLKNVGSIGASLVVWFCCGLIATCGSLSYAELGTMIPKSGAEYPYLLEAFGPVPAFLFAWTSSVVLKPSAVGIIGLVFGEYIMRPFFPNCDVVPLILIKLAGVCCICLVTFINCYSMKIAEKTQIVFTVAKLGALLIIIITGLVALGLGTTDNMQNAFSGEFKASTVGIALYQGLWAFDGWNQLNYITEELKNPYVNLPRAICIGIPLVTIVYLLTNIAYSAGLTMVELLGSRAVAVTFGDKLLGVMSWVIPVGVAISTFGGANGYTITGPRIIYTAARNGHTPTILSMVHLKHTTPTPAVLFNSLIAILVMMPNDFDTLVNYFSFAMWLFHGSCAVALIYMRWKYPDLPRPYKVPIILPILVVIFAVFLVFYPIISNPAWEYLYAALFILSGLVLYVPFIHYKINMPGSRCVTEFLQKLLFVAPSSTLATKLS